VRIAGILIVFACTGCAGVSDRPTSAEGKSAAETTPEIQPQPASSPAGAAVGSAPESKTAAPSPAATVAPPTAPCPPTTAPAPTPTPRAAVAAPPPRPVGKPAPTAAVPAAPAAPAPAAPVSAAAPAKPTTKPLDLASLEKRLRETRAIGVMTKLSLKNQVDDLLDKFRAHYRKQSNTTLAELRRPYDMLLLKVLSLLQDSDPTLARDIVASREAIWGILADPEKFTKANLMAGVTP
jgi:hypothetical protein